MSQTEMCAGNDQFGKDPRLCYEDLSPCYSGRAWKLLQEPRLGFIWFLTLKQQYKNNRLLMGGCRSLSFSPHVACVPGVPRSFRLHCYRSVASCTLCTPIVVATARRCWYKHWIQWQKQWGGGWGRPRGGKGKGQLLMSNQKTKKKPSHIAVVISPLPIIRILFRIQKKRQFGTFL